MSFLINPYAFLAAGGDFEPIATVTVGSGGASSIEFTSIPGTYQHLQVRMIARYASVTTGNDGVIFRVNSDTGSNYAWHRLYGTGASAAADGYASQTTAYPTIAAHGGNTANIFSANIVDILDYASTSKTKTIRCLNGGDFNGSGSVAVTSTLWNSTAAVTTITFARSGAYDFVQHTTAALYGVKA